MRRLLFGVLLVLGACRPASDPVPPGVVHFEIDMAAALKAGWLDPAGERVGLRGGVAPLSWNETIPLEDPDGNGVYEGDVMFTADADSTVPYKIKVDGEGNPNDGWEQGDNRVLLRSSTRVKRAFGDSTEPVPASYSGDIRHHASFGSGELVPPRDLVVYLPPGYDAEPDRRYPVLYLHDGQNVFDRRGAGNEWRFDEAAEELIAKGDMRPAILVGVANSPARIAEYTPTEATLPFEGGQGRRAGGSGRTYARYLVEEVKPFIDATYRTEPGFESTSVGGSSLGGLITMSIATWYPEVFSGYLVVSPSVWWGDGVILGMVADAPSLDGHRIWLDMGTREGEGAVGGAERLRDALLARGFLPGKDLRFVVDEGAEHTESAWAGRVPDMLRFLYGR